MKKHAKELLRLGWSVIPLGKITRDGAGKKIIAYPQSWKQYQTQKASLTEVDSWTMQNMGVVTGHVSGILVLDCDDYKDGFDKELFKTFRIPITPVQKTAGGGKQYFFKLPPSLNIRNDVCIGHAGSGMDIRAEGGMVIIAPSTTTYGEYEWLISPQDEPLADIPQALLTLLQTAKTAPGGTKHSLLELTAIPSGGGRNNAITAVIGKLLRTSTPEEWETDVWNTVCAINGTYKPPLDIQELRKTFNSVLSKEEGRRIKEMQDEAASKIIPVKEETIAPSTRKTFAQIINQEYPPVLFAVDPFFSAGTVNMISAPPNSWKSWIVFLMAVNMAKGTSLLGKFNTEKTKVLIVNEEDTEQLIASRYKALDIKDKNLDIYFRVALGAKLSKEYAQALIKECKEDGITVIMFDSLRSIHDADENSSTAMQPILDFLKDISREGITVIFTHHHKKRSVTDRGDSAESSRGSSAINAAIFGHISLEEVKKDEGTFITVRHLKSKTGPKLEPFDIKIESNDGKVSFNYSGDHSDAEQTAAQARKSCYEYVEKHGSEWTSTKQIVMAMKSIGEKYVRGALYTLTHEGILESATQLQVKNSNPTIRVTGAKNTKYYRVTSNTLEDVDEREMQTQTEFEHI